jgi:hypothetical protein
LRILSTISHFVPPNPRSARPWCRETRLRTRPLPPPLCPADFNGDGFVDFFDYLDFVAAFEIGC